MTRAGRIVGPLDRGGTIVRRAAVLVSMVTVACGTLPDRTDAQECVAGRRQAALRAKVSLEPGGTPLAGVEVIAHIRAATTQSDGVACVREVAPGSQRVIAWRTGYFPDSTRLDFEAGKVGSATLTLRRKPPPSFRLEGSWWLEVELGSPGRQYPHPARSVAGMVAFSPRVPNPMPRLFTVDDPVVRYEFGRHAIDFTPIFGGPVASDVSTTVFGGGASLFFEVSGLVESGDSATLDIVPRMSHGGLSLWGGIHGDTLSGRWRQNAFQDGARGTFVMVRRPWTPAADSLVRLAVEQDSVQRLESAAAEEAWHRRAGELRVRTYDEATGRYVEADYWIARQDDEPSDRLYTMVRSDSSGWSRYTEEEPGTYSVELFDYPCGELTYFADTTYVRTEMPRLTVVIRSGQRSELDLRIDTRAIRATRSYENLKGRSCTYPSPAAGSQPPERPDQRSQLPEDLAPVRWPPSPDTGEASIARWGAWKPRDRAQAGSDEGPGLSASPTCPSLPPCAPSVIPSTSPSTAAATTARGSRTQSCTTTPPGTSSAPMPSSSAG